MNIWAVLNLNKIVAELEGLGDYFHYLVLCRKGNSEMVLSEFIWSAYG